MAANERMTKAQLLELIQNKEQEITTLKAEIQAFEKWERYNDITEEITSVYKRFHGNFTREESLELTLALINTNQVPARIPYVRTGYGHPVYPSYR